METIDTQLAGAKNETSRQGFKPLHTTRSGPWGKLEFFYTFLDPPESILGACSRETTEWAFVDKDKAQAEDFLEHCGLERNVVSRHSQWISAHDGMVLRPSTEFIESLSATLRQKLYSELLKHFGGAAHLHEFVIERGAYRENTEGLNIPEEIIRRVEDRSIKIGKKTVFPEVAHTLSKISDPNTKLAFLKSLARNRALIARLQITPDSNLPQIAKWWKAGPNRTRAMPLLENALRTPGVDTLDLIHLLPPVPRRLLNTFASEIDEHDGSKPDCFWAAMNFFGESPSNRYLDPMPRQYYLHEKFDLMKPGTTPQFGDVTIIADLKNDKFVHAYVHVADDIVFTKNGEGKFFPYILMRRDDLMSRYIEESKFHTETYRLHGR